MIESADVEFGVEHEEGAVILTIADDVEALTFRLSPEDARTLADHLYIRSRNAEEI